MKKIAYGLLLIFLLLAQSAYSITFEGTDPQRPTSDQQSAGSTANSSNTAHLASSANMPGSANTANSSLVDFVRDSNYEGQMDVYPDLSIFPTQQEGLNWATSLIKKYWKPFAPVAVGTAVGAYYGIAPSSKNDENNSIILPAPKKAPTVQNKNKLNNAQFSQLKTKKQEKKQAFFKQITEKKKSKEALFKKRMQQQRKLEEQWLQKKKEREEQLSQLKKEEEEEKQQSSLKQKEEWQRKLKELRKEQAEQEIEKKRLEKEREEKDPVIQDIISYINNTLCSKSDYDQIRKDLMGVITGRDSVKKESLEKALSEAKTKQVKIDKDFAEKQKEDLAAAKKIKMEENEKRALAEKARRARKEELKREQLKRKQEEEARLEKERAKLAKLRREEQARLAVLRGKEAKKENEKYIKAKQEALQYANTNLQDKRYKDINGWFLTNIKHSSSSRSLESLIEDAKNRKEKFDTNLRAARKLIRQLERNTKATKVVRDMLGNSLVWKKIKKKGTKVFNEEREESKESRYGTHKSYGDTILNADNIYYYSKTWDKRVQSSTKSYGKKLFTDEKKIVAAILLRHNHRKDFENGDSIPLWWAGNELENVVCYEENSDYFDEKDFGGDLDTRNVGGHYGHIMALAKQLNFSVDYENVLKPLLEQMKHNFASPRPYYDDEHEPVVRSKSSKLRITEIISKCKNRNDLKKILHAFEDLNFLNNTTSEYILDVVGGKQGFSAEQDFKDELSKKIDKLLLRSEYSPNKKDFDEFIVSYFLNGLIKNLIPMPPSGATQQYIAQLEREHEKEYRKKVKQFFSRVVENKNLGNYKKYFKEIDDYVFTYRLEKDKTFRDKFAEGIANNLDSYSRGYTTGLFPEHLINKIQAIKDASLRGTIVAQILGHYSRIGREHNGLSNQRLEEVSEGVHSRLKQLWDNAPNWV